MAIFTNSATLSYAGTTLTSNTVTGEILETVSISKTAVADLYTPGSDVSYVIALVNCGAQDVAGLTVTDDLGGYAFGGGTVYPLAYRDGSMRMFVNGRLQEASAVQAGPPLSVPALSIPAGGSLMLVYEAELTAFAPLGQSDAVVNTATVSGGGISVPLTASASIAPVEQAVLSIRKSMDPTAVSVNGPLSYTFVIENTGSVPVTAADNAILSDTFEPILQPISVTYNGEAWTAGADYTYDPAAGEFASLPGKISVPAACFAQNADGTWAATPGTATVVISGTVTPGA